MSHELVVVRELVKAAKIWYAARTLSDQKDSKADKYLSKYVRQLLKWEKQATRPTGRRPWPVERGDEGRETGASVSAEIEKSSNGSS